jgi:hypothetical protein
VRAREIPKITVDDKGLAMIFVFGLPGYRGKQQCTPAILAARKVLDQMSKAGVRGTAGITSGTCFCGLVGDPRIRCEYAVMGGESPDSTRMFHTHSSTSPKQKLTGMRCNIQIL